MAKQKVIFRDIKSLLTLQGAAQKQARFVTDSDLSIIEKAAIAVVDGKIDWIGSTSKIPKEFKTFRSISLKGKTVLPAFIECHTHSLFGGSRRDEFEMRIRGATYQEIAARGGGIRSTVKQTREISSTMLEKELLKRLEFFAKQGATVVEVKSGYGLSIDSEVKMLKVIKSAAKKNKYAQVVSTYLGPHSASPEHDSISSYFKEIVTEHLDKVVKAKLSNRADIFIEQNYFTVEQGREYMLKARSLGMDVAIHADQLSRTGATQLAAKEGAISADHVIEAIDEDIQALAKSKTTAVLLPAADLYLKMKYPRARQMIEAGVRVALATDYNPGTSPTQSLSLVGVLARLEMKMTLAEVICAYTLGAAYALGLDHERGSLEVGKLADFITLDEDHHALFYEIGGSSVNEIYRNGQVLKFS